jgi:DnaB-like helicase N terminal domain
MWRDVGVEQALLGAVLADPPGQQHLLDLVEPSDMFRPWHGQVLAAMQRLRRRGQLPSPQNVYQEIQHDPDLPRSVALDAVPLAGLLGKSPRTAHAGTYAAIVVETGIRRCLQLAGSRVVQAAEGGDLDDALGQAARARAGLVACAARWTALPARLRNESGRLPVEEPLRPDRADTGRKAAPSHAHPPLSQNGVIGRDAAVAAGEPGETVATAGTFSTRSAVPGAASGTRSPDPAAREASGAALRDLIDDPCQLAVVRSWLRPEHFTHAASGRLYAVLLDMDASGQPIDPVTVAWAAGRRGLRTDPARLAGGTGPFAVVSAREVRRLGMLAQITSAGIAIQRDAADPRLTPSRLILAAARRLESVRDGTTREPGPAGTVAAPRPSREAAEHPEPEAAR